MAHQNEICLFCASARHSRIFRAHDTAGRAYEYHRCAQCGTVFLNPPPSQEVLNDSYDISYYGLNNDKFFPIFEAAVDVFRQRRARSLHSLVKSGNVLDIGCGNGKFLHHVGKRGPYRLYGSELDTTAATRASRYPEITLLRRAVLPGDFPEGYFNAVTTFHVFEHLLNPVETIDMVSSFLPPGGIFMISFPNIDSLQAKIFKRHWLHLDPPRHIFFIRPAYFEKLMQEAGFRKISRRFFSPEQNPFGWVQSILNTIFPKRDALYEGLKGNWKHMGLRSGFGFWLQMAFFLLSYPLFFLLDVIESLVGKAATVEYVFVRKDKDSLHNHQDITKNNYA